MDKEEWAVLELDSLFADSQDYKQKALLKATSQLIKEQFKRIHQMEGELDGKLWSPSNWGE
ncbi:MAG: hypothetical protein RR548_01295 [Carnobacterium sp.]|uniref:hypothetical protein n=1 Tax=unclassified Carnobacterium TaxID=257487 RepID=UPI001911BCF0|nr:hypothetical protein [Carnobacterium sp. CS13]QQP70349.1 hypothetical protein JHE06_00355 [Carnobacterium sp. CS13]